MTTHALDLYDIADRLTEACEAARDLTPDSDQDRELMLEAAEDATLAAAALVRAATRGTRRRPSACAEWPRTSRRPPTATTPGSAAA